MCWGKIFDADEFVKLHQFQRVNHFPGKRAVAGYSIGSSEGPQNAQGQPLPGWELCSRLQQQELQAYGKQNFYLY